MSLVDYASSSDDDDEEQGEQNHLAEEQVAKVSTFEQTREENEDFAEEVLRRRSEATINQPPAPKFDPPHPHTSQNRNNNKRLDSSVNKQGKEVSEQLEAPALKLPDASLLLNSPALPFHLANSTDHSSRVAAAMAESESRKRDLNGSSSSTHTRNKVPRGNLPHSKRVPDTAGGHLCPPQLTGRSNIVTEDISKLFVKRQDSSF